MSLTMTIEVSVPCRPIGRRGRKELRPGGEKAALPPGRVPRVSRLMALALRLDELVRTGQVASYSALASLGQVTRARVCQILTDPAPDHPGARDVVPEVDGWDEGGFPLQGAVAGRGHHGHLGREREILCLVE